MKLIKTEKEQKTLRASELMDKKTSEIIDAIYVEEVEEIQEALYEELDERYPETSINAIREESEEFQNKTLERLDKIEERLSRVDNHYLIVNKLEEVLTILKKK